MVTSWFFFFQAEDGIRDVAVTGVQTCALPISLGVGSLAAASALQEWRPLFLGVSFALLAGAWDLAYRKPNRLGKRRVGEEGRSRGVPDHLKKKKKQRRRSQTRKDENNDKHAVL